MKQRGLKLFFCGALIALISIASENGVALDQNKDRTGTPDGSNTCGQCHNSGSFNPFMNLTVTDQEGNAVSAYIPGDTLNLRYSITSLGGPSPSRHGFQTTALDSLLADAGQFINSGLNVQLEEVNTVTIPSRHVAEHAIPSPVGIFNVGWIAEEDMGPVTFYFAGIAANGDGDSSGDNAQNSTLTLNAAEPDGLAEAALSGVSLRHSAEGIWIESDTYEQLDNVAVYSLTGQLVSDISKVRLPHLIQTRRGIHVMSIVHERRTMTRKVLFKLS